MLARTRMLLAAVAGVLLIACAAEDDAAAQQCPTAIDATQLHLDYQAFDAAGWRDLLANGCVDAAVALLESYRTANAARLTPEQTRELNFHVAQSLAMSGRDQESIPHFEQARGGDEEWSAYVEATIAFLNHDAAALTAQRARYAQAPNASEMRLTFIDGFLACTDQPYVRAVHCAMAH